MTPNDIRRTHFATVWLGSTPVHCDGHPLSELGQRWERVIEAAGVPMVDRYSWATIEKRIVEKLKAVKA